jgi:hypothetical protein
MQPAMSRRVLLLGAGTGEATCGILYLASYLRRAGIEAFVRLNDDDATEAHVRRSLKPILERVQPHVVGISLKWFHHVARARVLAKAIRSIDPDVRIVLGGNSASFWWKELLRWDCVDDVVLGDGEVPFLALCRGDKEPPNVVSRARSSPKLGYIQGTQSSDVYYSHFDDIFLSQLDLASFSGWVAPGKGCGENCLYCSGTRGMQKATFGRATPFLRPTPSVQRDHREIVPRTWQLRYDFAGSTAAFLKESWDGQDLSRHATTYFLWGVPPVGLTQTLAGAFQRVFIVLDVGCFSESQRLEQIRRGLLKPCPTDDALLKFIAAARAYPNLELEISGIAGLPFATKQTLVEERALIDRLLEEGVRVGCQRLQAQPGALVTEHPERFGMTTEARAFDDFVDYFTDVDPSTETVPMVRYADPKFEAAVQRACNALDELVWKEQRITVGKRARLVNASVMRTVKLGDWLGSHRVPAKLAQVPVTVIRAPNGNGLACVPDTLSFRDPSLQQGRDAKALLDALARFETPAPADVLPRALVEPLVQGHFLRVV